MKKILLTGPEATGKSFLAAYLAKAFDCPWVPEFARSYLPQLGRSYEQDDLPAILRGQVLAEYQLAADDRPFLFCDTGPEVVYIWSEVKYQTVDPLIKAAVQGQSYDLHLLCYPDLIWEEDPLREAPDEATRLSLFERYRDLHETMGWDYQVITGQEEERQQAALRYVTNLGLQ